MKAKIVFIDYSKYPFLASPQKYFEEKYGYSLSLSEIFEIHLTSSVEKRVIERIIGAVKGKISEPKGLSDDEEIVSFYLSLVVLGGINDKWLTSRYSVFEAKRIKKHLDREKPEILEAIGKILGLNIQYLGSNKAYKVLHDVRKGRAIYTYLPFKVTVYDYLKSLRLHTDPSWKLSNQIVNGGYVYLTHQRVSRFLEEIISQKIAEMVKPIEIDVLPEKIKKLVKAVSKEYYIVREEHVKEALKFSLREKFEELKFLEIIEPEAFPPCIKTLYDEAIEGKHLSHHARFALASFLLNIGLDVDSVVNVFRKLPDFNEAIARYQVEHLAGLRGSRKKYKPYNCDTMRTLGLCISECKVKNPLVYYYREVLRRMVRRD